MLCVVYIGVMVLGVVVVKLDVYGVWLLLFV